MAPPTIETIVNTLADTINQERTDLFDQSLLELLRLKQTVSDWTFDKTGSTENLMTTALASIDCYYWKQLSPHMSRELNIHADELAPECTPFCSLPVITFLHEEGYLTSRWWAALLLDVGHGPAKRLQALWQIRLSPSGICSDADRAIMGEALRNCTTCYHLPTLALTKTIEALLALYPESIADHQELLIHSILISRANLSDWLEQTDLVDRSLILPMILGLPDRLNPKIRGFLERISATAEVQYFCRDNVTFLISWSPLTIPRVEGWTTFRFAGRYFYSKNLYLNRITERLELGTMTIVVSPMKRTRYPRMPQEEELVQIEYGRTYQTTLAIPAPVILQEWYRTHHVKSKSARSAAC